MWASAWGAGRLSEAKRYAKSLIGVNYAILLVLSSSMVLFSGELVGIYRLSEQALRLSRELITAHSIAMLVSVSYTHLTLPTIA